MRQLSLFEAPQQDPSFKNFTIYRSSAGSGKTFTLVKEYLKIVLRNPQDYKHILAITFTNKATEEMKFRILEALRSLAEGKDGDMRNIIEQEFAHFPQKVPITSRAQKALNNILHNYSRFAISTIDHFFSQLVRALARELRLNLNYEIDVDDQTAMEESLQMLYNRLHQSQELQDWIKDFAFNRIDQDKGWQLDYNLIEFGKELFKEKFHQGFSRIDPEEVNLKSLRELEQQLQNTKVNYQAHQRDLARKALDLIKQHGLKIDDFKYRNSGAAKTFQNFIYGKFELKKRFIDVAQGYDDWYTSSSLKAEQIKTVASSGLDELASEILAFHQKHYEEYVSAQQLQRHIYSYGLLEALNEQLKVYRQQHNLMLLSHNSFLLKEVIADREAPFLFEKLGSYYHHVLIDEFQDTSTYQWDNVKPLVTHALDNQNHVLLVGDVKQSIYRWRGGDLNLLLSKAQDDLSLYKDQLEEKNLLTNRRSAESVVKFNNTFFALANKLLLNTDALPDDSSMLTEVYRDVEQEVHASARGKVQIKFFERNDNQWVQQSAEYLLELVAQHLERGGSYRDFLVLLSKNEEVTYFTEFLTQNGVPAISEQALRLSNNWAVRMAISGMRLVLDPFDSLAQAELSYLYQKGTGREDLVFHELFEEALKTPHGPMWSYLPPSAPETWERIKHKPVFAWVSELVALLIAEARPNPFLQRFLEVCLEQTKKGLHTLQDFIEWWEQHQDQQMVVSPSDQDALNVMTIHKAKGLEAPIVVIPKADFELKPRKDSIFWTDYLTTQYQRFKLLPLSFSKELLDSHFQQAYRQELLEGLIEGLNVTYVAFTRPRHELYVNSVKPSSDPKIDDLGNLYKLAWTICQDEVWKEAWDPVHQTFTLGSSDQFSNPSKEAIESNDLACLQIGAYETKVQIRSNAADFFMLLDHEKAHQIKEGIKLHAVLERLRHPEELDWVLQHLQASGIIENQDHETLRSKIAQLFENQLFASWFNDDWQVLTERSLIHQRQRYQPDRVLFKGNQAVVIDYKKQQQDTKHHQQIKRYGQLIQAMGWPQISMYLVYVDNLEIVEVDG